MKKVALITGVTGQDGAYLSEFLLKKGRLKLNPMDRKKYNIISFVIIGIVLFVGRHLGLNLLERIIYGIIISGTFEII